MQSVAFETHNAETFISLCSLTMAAFYDIINATGCVINKEFILMITQFVNQIEHHPESLFVQEEIMARMKRDTLSAITKRLHAIRAFWRRILVRQPPAGRNVHAQCGGVERGCQETL